MSAAAHRGRLFSSWLLAIGLASSGGCLNFCHPLPTMGPEVSAPCQEVPPLIRRHVYVFMLNGIDPLSCGNLEAVRGYVNDLGFTQTYYGQCFDFLEFVWEIRRLHKDDPAARFVLVGFSAGANAAEWVADWLRSDKIPIELLVYLDACLMGKGEHRPDNVVQVLNIVGGCGKEMDATENVPAPGVWHFGTPTHPAALCALAKALTVVAERVPLLPPVEPVPLVASTPPPAGEPVPTLPNEMAPTPRPLKPLEPGKSDDGDFLKPKERLEPLPDETAPTPRTVPPASARPNEVSP